MRRKARTKKPAPAGKPASGTDDGQDNAADRLRAALENLIAMIPGLGSSPALLPAPAVIKELDAEEIEFLRLTRNPAIWTFSYIAARMKKKLSTLHYMRRKVYAKLGVDNRTALVLLVSRWDLG